jgi:DNA polymerase III delta prime subunit
MSLVTNLTNLATRIATELKAVRTLINGNQASLAALTTTAKGDLVSAINEVKAAADAASSSGGAQINDAASSTTTTYSSSKIHSEINAKVADLVAAAPATLDTFKELADALGGDANFAATTAAALGNRLRFDASQTLTDPQKLTACGNIGVGNPQTNFVTTF